MGNDIYGKAEALALASKLGNYEQQTINGAVAVANVLSSSGWKDGKSKQVIEACRNVLEDIRTASKTVGEYRAHLENKIHNF